MGLSSQQLLLHLPGVLSAQGWWLCVSLHPSRPPSVPATLQGQHRFPLWVPTLLGLSSKDGGL